MPTPSPWRFLSCPLPSANQPKDKRESEREMLDLLGRNVDLIVLAPYLQILGPDFVAQYLLGHNQYP
jgi:formyltetrahydrofolate hydrolase